MKCPDNGVIQAYIDGELELDSKKELENHFGECVKCSEALAELRSNDDFVFCKMKAYEEYIKTNTAKKCEQAHRLEKNSSEIHENNNAQKGVYKTMLNYKKFVAAACAALVVTTCIVYQPARAAISNSLLIFRADNVKSLKITSQDLRSIQEKLSKNEAEIDLNQMGKVKNTGGKYKEISLTEAQSINDFKVMFPTETYGLSPKISTNEQAAMEFTLNIDYINKVMKTMGAKKLMPMEVDGKTFEVNIPRSVTMSYDIDSEKGFCIVQTKAPQINAPEGVNPDDLYNALVEMPIIPENLKSQLKSIKDWKNTLYVPVVDSQMQEISVNGVKGYILPNKNPDGSSNSSIIWCSNDVIYAISGNLSVDELIKVGNSMR